MNSVFSKIISGDIPCYKVAEDINNLAFLDINPLTKGHTLVIPKIEINYIFDLDLKCFNNLWVFARKVADVLDRNIECKRVAVLVLGLEVPHVHIHLIPIKSEKDLNLSKDRFKMTNNEFVILSDLLFNDFIK